MLFLRAVIKLNHKSGISTQIKQKSLKAFGFKPPAFKLLKIKLVLSKAKML